MTTNQDEDIYNFKKLLRDSSLHTKADTIKNKLSYRSGSLDKENTMNKIKKRKKVYNSQDVKFGKGDYFRFGYYNFKKALQKKEE